MAKTIRLPKLMPWQLDIMNSQSQHLNEGKTFVIKSARQRGKSFLICNLALWRALQRYNRTVIIMSPTNSQNARIFKQLKNAIVNTPLLKSANAGSLIITLFNNSEIVFKSAEQRDAVLV